MAIYDPVPTFSVSDRRLLYLLGELLLERLDGEPHSSNVGHTQVVLTDRQAAELLTLIEQLLSSRQFLEKITFVEIMANGDQKNELRAKEIYLAGRRRTGRTRVASSWLWADFQTRLGINRWVSYRPVRSRTMDLHHFLQMEARLFDALPCHPRVATLILELQKRMLPDIEAIREQGKRIPLNIRGDIVRPIVDDLRDRTAKQTIGSSTNKYNVSALFTVVSDLSVLFTTRDWGVAGTMSTISGALMLIKN